MSSPPLIAAIPPPDASIVEANDDRQGGDNSASRLVNGKPRHRGRITAVACAECQKRRSKCDGRRPQCLACDRRKTPCCYDTEHGVRRTDALKKKHGELAGKMKEYNDLVAMLRTASEGEAVELVRRLKSNEGVVEAMTAVSQMQSERANLLTPSDSDSPSIASSPEIRPHLESRGVSRMPILTQRSRKRSEQGNVHPSESRIHEAESFLSAFGFDDVDWAVAAAAAPRSKRAGKEVAMGEYIETFRNLPMSSSIAAAAYPPYMQQHQVSNFRIPVWAIQPLNYEDNSPMNKAVTSYRDAARRLIGFGTPAEHIFGEDLAAEWVDVTAFFRDQHYSGFKPVGTWASEFNKSFHDVDIYVRLACVLMQTHLMRWMIQPTAETYAKIPELLKPTLQQRLVPHMSPVDTVPIPGFRDALINRLRDWVTPLAASLSCNWPYSIGEATIVDPVTQKIRLSRLFEMHVVRPENWSIGPNVVEVFPEVVGQINIKEVEA